MLPWLFGVLLLLNAVLFYWGYQRESSQEPVLPPLPEAPEEVRLLSELDAPAGRSSPGQTAPSEGRASGPASAGGAAKPGPTSAPGADHRPEVPMPGRTADHPGIGAGTEATSPAGQGDSFHGAGSVHLI